MSEDIDTVDIAAHGINSQAIQTLLPCRLVVFTTN